MVPLRKGFPAIDLQSQLSRGPLVGMQDPQLAGEASETLGYGAVEDGVDNGSAESTARLLGWCRDSHIEELGEASEGVGQGTT